MPILIDAKSGRLYDKQSGVSFADQTYCYAIAGSIDNPSADRAPVTDSLISRKVVSLGDRWLVGGTFVGLGIAIDQTLEPYEDGIAESIALTNMGAQSVRLSKIAIGFAASLPARPNWRLAALPFYIQLDGTGHEYTTANLLAGEFSNAAYADTTRPEPELSDTGQLRSEAWAWGDGISGIVVAKYNPAAVELSVAAIEDGALRFGGVGSSLYGEPSAGHTLAPGQKYIFGATYYLPFRGGLTDAASVFRAFLETHGHGFPVDYDPPVNWNVLYDIGWFHSDPVKIAERYTRETLLAEASKARDCRCGLLYLDPGWEIAEGATLWAEDRLGTPGSLADTLEREYDLALGFRTILRCYRDHWPQNYLVMREDGSRSVSSYGVPGSEFWDPCLCYSAYFDEKLDRISTIIDEGRVKFLMVDEMDWRGPCHDPAHGHPVPTTAAHHLDAVYRLCKALRQRFPDLLIECHDPIWPWHTSIYAPTYYQQGFDNGAYQETWGFEYMWNTLTDLKTGKAMALYAYNQACNIPIYLHITMNSDNDNALFFWWAASTVRHLGIGGKYGHDTVGKIENDPEARFAKYREAMALYDKLKAYFVRGEFHGLTQTAHLHTLPGVTGGVLTLFNVTEYAKDVACDIPLATIGANANIAVGGAASEIIDGAVRIQAALPPMSPLVVGLGAAAAAV